MNSSSVLRAILPGPLLLGCFIASLHWNTAALPLIRDEGEYAYAASLFRYGALPYTDSFLQKPPMIVYTYWLAQLVDDGTGRGARWLLVLFQTASALVLGAIARREIGPNAVWPASLLLGPLLLMPNLDQCAANVEQFMILPLLVLGLLYSANRATTDLKPWFAAGFVTAVAFLYKYTCAPIGGFILATWLFESFFVLKRVRQTFMSATATLAGFLLGSLLISCPFLIHDGGRDLYDCTVRFNRHYAAVHTFSARGFFSQLGSIGASWWILILLGGIFLYSQPRARRWFYVGLIAAAIVSTAGSWYGHYYLPLIPLIAFGAAGGMTVIVPRIAALVGIRADMVNRLLVVAGMIVALFPNWEALRMSPGSIERARYAPYVFAESTIAAKKLAELTSPEDRVLVAGSEPEILYYAGRRSSTRFVIAYPMTLPTIMAESYQIQAVRELSENPPRAIVLVRSPDSWLISRSTPDIYLRYFEELLRTNYTLVGGFRKSGDSGNWTDQVSVENLQDCSLALFARRSPESELAK